MTTHTFWQNKKVLVTGAGGFVGSGLSRRLVAAGAQVLGISRRPVTEALSDLDQQLLVVSGDLANKQFVDDLFAAHAFEAVFHLAASAIVIEAVHHPWETIQNNIQATANILEAVRVHNVPRVVVASSDKAYGDHAEDEFEQLPFRETYALRGLDIYSATKVCADTLAQAYAFQYKIPIAVVRSCNIYGPGDLNFTRLIPKTIMLLLGGRPPEIKAGHEQVLREYLYIDDAVSAYLLLAERIQDYYARNRAAIPIRGKETYGWWAFNLGSYTAEQTQSLARCPNIQSVAQVVESLRQSVEGTPAVIAQAHPQFIEIPNEFLDSSKILQFGFQSSVSFSEGLKRSVQWYTEQYKLLKEYPISTYEQTH